LDCIDKCRQGAIKYVPRAKVGQSAPSGASADKGRRAFIAGTAMVAGASVAKAQKLKMDGGYAVIEDKKIPNRETPLTPPGSLSARNLAQHCTACQLCISACPNQVLRPSGDLSNFMQPVTSFERGYCRPECVKCSEVCPTGAIKPITKEEKTAIQIGHAVWIADNCVVNRDNEKCDNCFRHCPTGAIQMVAKNPDDKKSPKIPVINTERCIFNIYTSICFWSIKIIAFILENSRFTQYNKTMSKSSRHKELTVIFFTQLHCYMLSVCR
jgi:formate hydrogenlyase subunit 6/NADH:ubiquinone oxidoreductase subunit I